MIAPRLFPLASTLSFVAALVMASALAHAQTSGDRVQLKSWGYQLQNVDPDKLRAVPYDVFVIDYSRDGRDETALSAADVEKLKFKPDGTRRVVLAYMSIGEAESYRYYWNTTWSDLWFIPNVFSKPSWRGKLNGDWGGNYAVRYWEPEWQNIILGQGGYLDRILRAGFDGVWLDKVDSSLEDVAKGRPTAKADMIAFVTRIAEKGRAARAGFLVFPQNGGELLADASYRNVIDGFGKEDLLYGEEGVGTRNKASVTAEKVAHLKPLVAAGKPVLAVEYLDSKSQIDQARAEIASYGYVPHFGERSLSAMRVGDYPEVAVGTNPDAPRTKSRSKEPGWFDVWKKRILLGVAGVVLLIGLSRRHRSY